MINKSIKFVLLFVLFSGYLRASDKPMNILVLYADDWRYDAMGVAGNEIIKTPVVDRLAKDGVRFTQNAVTTSICGASRANLLTGQWISRNGCNGFSMFRTPWNETYPGILRDKGYYVGHVGKWHNGKFPVGKYDFETFYAGKHWYPVEGPPVTPDPTKTYYIDCPSTGGRLAAQGGRLKAVAKTETGASVQWKFVAKGDRWHIEHAEGGDKPRLWATKGEAQLTDTGKGGGEVGRVLLAEAQRR